MLWLRENAPLLRRAGGKATQNFSKRMALFYARCQKKCSARPPKEALGSTGYSVLTYAARAVMSASDTLEATFSMVAFLVPP